MSNYVVLEAANLDEAMHCLERQPADAVLAALNLPPDGSSALFAAMRRRPDWEKIPVLAIADSAEDIQTSKRRAQGFQDCQTKLDSISILESVAKLVSATASDELELECMEEMR
jgi:CheY-like chemotaxis protein